MQQIILNDQFLREAQEAFAAQRFVLMRKFLSTEGVQALLGATKGFAESEVKCGLPDVSWGEQKFQSPHEAYQFFLQTDLLVLMAHVIGKLQLQNLTVWTSVYRRDKYINPHRDRSGTIQLLICLANTAGPELGGALGIEGSNEEIFLEPGDAVLFEATSLTHYTTPLVSSEKVPEPIRIVLVARYFF